MKLCGMIALLCALAACAPPTPEQQATSPALIGIGTGLMFGGPGYGYSAPSYYAPPRNQTCSWMGPEWRCTGW